MDTENLNSPDPNDQPPVDDLDSYMNVDSSVDISMPEIPIPMPEPVVEKELSSEPPEELVVEKDFSKFKIHKVKEFL